jgi:hypothetical protein
LYNLSVMARRLRERERIHDVGVSAAIEEAKVTAASILSELETARAMAERLEDPGNMSRASLGKAKLAGLLVERRDVTVSQADAYADLSDLERFQHILVDVCSLIRAAHRSGQEEQTVETFFEIVFAIASEPIAEPLPSGVRPRTRTGSIPRPVDPRHPVTQLAGLRRSDGSMFIEWDYGRDPPTLSDLFGAAESEPEFEPALPAPVQPPPSLPADWIPKPRPVRPRDAKLNGGVPQDAGTHDNRRR